MSPKEPLPIFRTSLYLPPTWNSAFEDPLVLVMAQLGLTKDDWFREGGKEWMR